MTDRRRIKLPPEVAAIYEAVDKLEARYPGRKFTPDGHLVGSIGEVIAAERFGLTLYPGSHPGHDAVDKDRRDVQVKLTAGKGVSMYDTCDRLIALLIVSPQEAEVVYDGDGKLAWDSAGGSKERAARREPRQAAQPEPHGRFRIG